MSIVGTRPPTLDEWNKYELHHRARLAIKPGITGKNIFHKNDLCGAIMLRIIDSD